MRLLFLICLVILYSCTSETGAGFTTTGLLDKQPSASTGITFKNTIKADVSTQENLLDFDYFYNGAGVGVADLNNDGLVDIFFCGNQVDNQLYINKGDFTFEEISATAGINKHKHWSNGVTFVDINMDGWLDIYVSQGGPRQPDQRKNLLYINNQDLTFTESAAQYGLDDASISTQSAFFDYDKDGDLDCIVMNESSIYGIGPIPFYEIMNVSKPKLHECSSHLYRNDGDTFVDVTAEAGLLYPSFGLGLVVSDINADGWLDIYMANDYYLPDVMYINNKAGGFVNEIKQRSTQISFFGMGADIEDIDNDGHNDILVLDMASADHYRSKTLMASMDTDNFDLLVKQFQFPYQYMFNTLQINGGNQTFSNQAHLAGLAKTDWSWAGLMTDLDMDGNKEVFVTNGYRRYALDNDFKNKVTDAKVKYQGKVPLEVKKELYYQMPSEKLNNLIYTRAHTRTGFKEVAQAWGVDAPSFSNGAAYGDFDNDGDYDIVINNIDEEAHIYKNNAVERGQNFIKIQQQSIKDEGFAQIKLTTGGTTQSLEMKTVRGYLSSNDPAACLGIGSAAQIDTLTIRWPSGKVYTLTHVDANQVLQVDNKGQVGAFDNPKLPLFTDVSIGELKLYFKHKENDYNDFATEILLPQKQSSLGPVISKVDFNKDNKTDLFIGGASGQSSKLFVQDGGVFTISSQPALEADMTYEDLGAAFFDIDNDDDMDLYVVSGGNAWPSQSSNYQDRFYRNNNGVLVRESLPVLTANKASGKEVITMDYNQDGYVDILVVNRIEGQQYPKAAASHLYMNDKGTLINVTADVFPDLQRFGIINQALSTDFNQDGQEDIIIAGEWTGIGMYAYDGNSFVNVNADLMAEKGWWFSIHETDVNADGLPDYILGNLGRNTKFKATKDKPFKVYANDFDTNGTLDIVLSNVYKDEYVPVRGRECSSQQMPFLLDEYTSYDAYANASIVDIYGDKVDDAYVQEVNTFLSMILMNRGGENFDIEALPYEAQSFPILDVVTFDFNNDGYFDILAGGCIYNTEVETPRYDAGNGLVLLSDQRGNYVAATDNLALDVSGNIKSIVDVTLGTEDKPYFIFGRNDELLKIIKMNSDR